MLPDVAPKDPRLFDVASNWIGLFDVESKSPGLFDAEPNEAWLLFDAEPNEAWLLFDAEPNGAWFAVAPNDADSPGCPAGPAIADSGWATTCTGRRTTASRPPVSGRRS